ncbi:MAG TPA: hypothetical protein DDX71_04525 [Ruminococcus sp.]|nr:hypothetical protein [Ruminococcus sp.]
MSRKKELHCDCGAPFTSEGVCTVCGKKRPRSAGYRVWHSFWCVIATLILLLCINTTAAMRHALRTNAPVTGLHDSRLSDMKIPFTGKTLAAYIKSGFVADENVLETDIASAVDEMDIPVYLSGKLGAYYQLLRGESDAVVTVTEDEIVGMLDMNRTALLNQCMLIIEDADIAELRNTVSGPLGFLSSTAETAYGSPAGRMLAHFRVSVARIVLDVLLLGLLLWRWSIVYRNSGRPAARAVRSMGITIGVPACITFLLVLITGVGSLFVSDSVTGIHPLTKAIRAPYWAISATELLAAAAMVGAAYLIARQTARAAAKPAKASAPEHVSVPRPAAEPPVRTLRARGTADSPAPGKPCISCGRELKAEAKFCIYCGANQDADAVPEPDVQPEKAPRIDLSKTKELPHIDS